MKLNGLWFPGAVALACIIGGGTPGSSAAMAADASCTAVAAAAPLTGVAEASGLALSRRTPGVLWTHNDSGQPVLFAFDSSGTARGRVRIGNAAVEDWEDVTAARCPAGNCLYVADIGDNDAVRRTITLYRFPEPAPADTQVNGVEVFTAAYPDGARDAEALFVAGDEVFLVSKESRAAVYRFPKPLRAGTTMTLERVAELPLRMVTDAEASADGTLVAVRTADEVVFFRVADLIRGGAPAFDVSLAGLREAQGEGVALDTKGTLYLSSEAGDGERSGTLRTLRCTLPVR